MQIFSKVTSPVAQTKVILNVQAGAIIAKACAQVLTAPRKTACCDGGMCPVMFLGVSTRAAQSSMLADGSQRLHDPRNFTRDQAPGEAFNSPVLRESR